MTAFERRKYISAESHEERIERENTLMKEVLGLCVQESHEERIESSFLFF